jgi:riboflavin kinase / FMN adenylyltransferase
MTRFVHGLEHIDDALRGGVLTIGNFDGVHRGHRALLDRARALADAEDVPVVAMTFTPPPDRTVRPIDPPVRLCTHAEKLELLSQAGADVVLTAAADKALMQMTAEAFIQEILIGRLAPRHMVEGPDFFFGRNRAGTIDTLARAGQQAGFTLHVVEALLVEVDGEPTKISSTLIRHLLSHGRVAQAAELLCRNYTLHGEIIHGEQIGREMNCPTANIARSDQLVPGDGVYAGIGRIGEKHWPAAISIGHKPTFGYKPTAIEAHLIGASGDLYGQKLDLEFVQFLREQENYGGSALLAEQIAEDIRRIEEIIDDE